MSATGWYRDAGIHWDWAVAKGRPFHYFANGAAVAEVEVDGYSGMHRVRRVDIVQDVGVSLNPGVDRGQIEGGFVQGMGWLTHEELRWDPEGPAADAQREHLPDSRRSATRRPEMHVTLLPNAPQAECHPRQQGGRRTASDVLAFSVREAIRDAVGAFGKPGGEVRLASPATGRRTFSGGGAGAAGRVKSKKFLATNYASESE